MFPIYDAVIIGAGPAGSFCAYKLSKLGMKVLLLESQAKIKRKVCGEYLSPMGVEILKEESLEKNLINPFLPIKGMKIVPSEGAALHTKFPEKEGIALNRQTFDENFIELAKQAGATFRLSSRVNAIQKLATGWQIKVNETDTFHTRLLIGADGRNSYTAKALGLKNDIDTSRVALHCHVKAKRSNKRMGEMHLFKDGSYIGVDPTGDTETNLSLCCQSSILKGKSPREVFNCYIQESPEILEHYGLIAEDIKVNTVTPITNKMPKFIGKNAALIGDAAGFLDPLTGEGMYNALWMAKTLADEIESSSSISIFDYQNALISYSQKKNSFFKQKAILNKIFQFIIKRPTLVNILAWYLRRSQDKANIFVGIIGNIYRPIDGILRLLKA